MRAADYELKAEERTDSCPRLGPQIVSEQPIAQNLQMGSGKGTQGSKIRVREGAELIEYAKTAGNPGSYSIIAGSEPD